MVRVAVARTREGLEAVELSTGRPLGAVALPAAASGAGVYADLNGDGVVDHVQVGVRDSYGYGDGGADGDRGMFLFVVVVVVFLVCVCVCVFFF